MRVCTCVHVCVCAWVCMGACAEVVGGWAGQYRLVAGWQERQARNRGSAGWQSSKPPTHPPFRHRRPHRCRGSPEQPPTPRLPAQAQSHTRHKLNHTPTHPLPPSTHRVTTTSMRAFSTRNWSEEPPNSVPAYRSLRPAVRAVHAAARAVGALARRRASIPTGPQPATFTHTQARSHTPSWHTHTRTHTHARAHTHGQAARPPPCTPAPLTSDTVMPRMPLAFSWATTVERRQGRMSACGGGMAAVRGVACLCVCACVRACGWVGGEVNWGAAFASGGGLQDQLQHQQPTLASLPPPPPPPPPPTAATATHTHTRTPPPPPPSPPPPPPVLTSPPPATTSHHHHTHHHHHQPHLHHRHHHPPPPTTSHHHGPHLHPEEVAGGEGGEVHCDRLQGLVGRRGAGAAVAACGGRRALACVGSQAERVAGGGKAEARAGCGRGDGLARGGRGWWLARPGGCRRRGEGKQG